LLGSAYALAAQVFSAYAVRVDAPTEVEAQGGALPREIKVCVRLCRAISHRSGITLGPERGEFGADFCSLGINQYLATFLQAISAFFEAQVRVIRFDHCVFLVRASFLVLSIK
jgi:hypothetical protein